MSATGVVIHKLAPHDLRRSCARFCYESGGELEQIQFRLGHATVLTTERYLGCKQRISSAVNDRIEIQGAGMQVPAPRSAQPAAIGDSPIAGRLSAEC